MALTSANRCSSLRTMPILDDDVVIMCPTVWLKWIAHFAVGILLVHHYKRNLSHLPDFYSLVIGMYKYEI